MTKHEHDESATITAERTVIRMGIRMPTRTRNFTRIRTIMTWAAATAHGATFFA